MSEMHELCELYEESNDPQMDVVPGESDLPQMEVGGGSREPSPKPARRGALPQLEEGGPMEEEEGQPGRIAGPDLESEDEGEELDGWEDEYDRPEEQPPRGAGRGVSAALDEADKVCARRSGARGAALHGGLQVHCEKAPFDQLAFIEELFSLMVVNRLTEELGCDEMIDRE